MIEIIGKRLKSLLHMDKLPMSAGLFPYPILPSPYKREGNMADCGTATPPLRPPEAPPAPTGWGRCRAGVVESVGGYRRRYEQPQGLPAFSVVRLRRRKGHPGGPQFNFVCRALLPPVSLFSLR